MKPFSKNSACVEHKEKHYKEPAACLSFHLGRKKKPGISTPKECPQFYLAAEVAEGSASEHQFVLLRTPRLALGPAEGPAAVGCGWGSGSLEPSGRSGWWISTRDSTHGFHPRWRVPWHKNWKRRHHANSPTRWRSTMRHCCLPESRGTPCDRYCDNAPCFSPQQSPFVGLV